MKSWGAFLGASTFSTLSDLSDFGNKSLRSVAGSNFPVSLRYLLPNFNNPLNTSLPEINFNVLVNLSRLACVALLHLPLAEALTDSFNDTIFAANLEATSAIEFNDVTVLSASVNELSISSILSSVKYLALCLEAMISFFAKELSRLCPNT